MRKAGKKGFKFVDNKGRGRKRKEGKIDGLRIDHAEENMYEKEEGESG